MYHHVPGDLLNIAVYEILYRMSDLEGFFEVYQQWEMEATSKIWGLIPKCISNGKGVSVC